jgi:MarR family transcriptional regulator, organic hydroperoxide resistance regulator
MMSFMTDSAPQPFAGAILRQVAPEHAWLANLDLRSPAEEISALLGALVPSIERRLQKVASEQGLSKAQAQLLAQLPARQALSQREMSERLHCAPSSVVGVIDSLEQRGWLMRRVDSTDRRINVLVLTPAGREARDRLMHQLLEPPTAIRGLSKQAQEQLRDVLRAVVQELESGDSG